MTRIEAETQLHRVIEYLKPEAQAWLDSEQPSGYEEGIWDAYFVLNQRLSEMLELDDRDEDCSR